MRYSDFVALCTYRGKPADRHVFHDLRQTEIRAHRNAMLVRYVDTDILTVLDNDTVELATGGWFTDTTMRRMEHFLNGLSGAYGNGYGGAGVTFRIGGNPWTVSTRLDGEPVVTAAPFGEGMRFSLITGELGWGGEMCDFADANKATRKAIKAFVKGMTPENLAACEEDMAGTLAEDVASGRYSVELFYDMTLKGRYGNPQFVYRVYVEPLLYGTAGNNGEHYARMLRRDTISYLREMLMIGPVPIRKNFGQPRYTGVAVGIY